MVQRFLESLVSVGGVAGLVYLLLTCVRLWGFWSQFRKIRREKGAHAVSFPFYVSIIFFSLMVMVYGLVINEKDPMGGILIAVSIANIAVSALIAFSMLVSHRSEIVIVRRMQRALQLLALGVIVSWALLLWNEGKGVDWAFFAFAVVGLYLQTDQTKALWEKGRGTCHLT